MNMIEFKNVSKNYNDFQVLKDISFIVKEKSITGFIGQNGAGKTTSLKLLLYLLNKNSGIIKVLGKELNENNAFYIKKNIGYVGSDVENFGHLKLIEFWTFVSKIYKIQKATIDKRIKELAIVLELTDSLTKQIFSFSTGMKKKAFIGAALIHNPKLLILDEPFEGIDPLSRKTIKNILKQLNENGVTIFISSHDLTLVDDFCNELILIDKGEIKYCSSIRELHEKYNDLNLEDIFATIINYKSNYNKLSWLEDKED
ncbi:ABC-2 type transport system ATP-binding protein/sodium transport system ATP-binding protein [Clostridium sp. USBA 49]|uniref:ABC transporter ATP-binding protein n=1 Tax=Clostridium sp. USBA 49 TaxID=1881060 RepID=UPI000999CCE9|nr:ABC transporter ATP-binding protein [Clostridium sp. USBA 49]SKA85079.1 ABC-2 type transport system ATP-binding protein/sodium transport system ATP-binding protein [Clostridium sp. USBA 49]